MILTPILMPTSVTKSPGIVEKLFSLRLSPRVEVSKYAKAWGFVND